MNMLNVKNNFYLNIINNKGYIMGNKFKIVSILIICIMLISGCEMFTNELSENDKDEYDYRQMYLDNDTKDLTDKDLEAFNSATKVYNLYIKSCNNDYKKVIAAHDYIIKNCVYNVEGIDDDTLTDDDFTAYGVLVKGKAVCEGYAKAFKMLMDIADIDCIMVTGTVGEDDIPHAWNMVKLEDSWYHVDVTYDDPNPETKEIVYVYMNVTDDIIEKDHTWNKNTTPEAKNTKYDYLKKNQTFYDSNDEIIEYIKECDDEREVYTSFIWTGKNEIEESVWKSALKDTDISNLSFSCFGVEGRRLYMINLVY